MAAIRGESMMIPCIKCSVCGEGVAISAMGDHACRIAKKGEAFPQILGLCHFHFLCLLAFPKFRQLRQSFAQTSPYLVETALGLRWDFSNAIEASSDFGPPREKTNADENRGTAFRIRYDKTSKSQYRTSITKAISTADRLECFQYASLNNFLISVVQLADLFFRPTKLPFRDPLCVE
jgi:hypothetical protein